MGDARFAGHRAVGDRGDALAGHQAEHRLEQRLAAALSPRLPGRRPPPPRATVPAAGGAP